MIPTLDIHGDKSQLQLMFVNQVCKECGVKATVLVCDAEENETFLCYQHAPANYKKWWLDDNDNTG